MLDSTLSEKIFFSIFIFSNFPNIPRFELRLILVLSSQMCVDWNLKWPDVEVFHTKTAIYLNGQHLEVFHIEIFIWNCTFSEMPFCTGELGLRFVTFAKDQLFNCCIIQKFKMIHLNIARIGNAVLCQSSLKSLNMNEINVLNCQILEY